MNRFLESIGMLLSGMTLAGYVMLGVINGQQGPAAPVAGNPNAASIGANSTPSPSSTPPPLVPEDELKFLRLALKQANAANTALRTQVALFQAHEKSREQIDANREGAILLLQQTNAQWQREYAPILKDLEAAQAATLKLVMDFRTRYNAAEICGVDDNASWTCAGIRTPPAGIPNPAAPGPTPSAVAPAPGPQSAPGPRQPAAPARGVVPPASPSKASKGGSTGRILR